MAIIALPFDFKTPSYTIKNTMNQKIEPNQLSVIVSQDDSGKRLDAVIAHATADYSRSFINKLIKAGQVTVNGTSITKPSMIVNINDIILITIPQVPHHDIQAITAHCPPIEIIYEHKDFFIINKPAGLLVHQPFRASTDITLVDWLLATHPNLASIGPSERPGIIHRLDKDTSGLLIIPRTQRAYTFFGTMFRERTISKTYLALVQGHLEKPGTIDLYVGRDPRNPTKIAAFDHETAQHYIRHGYRLRHAITHYRPLEHYSNYTLVEVKPVTGRTHQIRVHLGAIGHPILNDVVYGTNTYPSLKRQALHASELTFSFNDQPFHFSSALPDDMQKTIIELKKNSA
jgi:23S rRNA pseudouridine1911/1915/1917 synthase